MNFVLQVIITFSPTFRPLLAERPDIVIGTPSRVLSHLKAMHFNVKDSLRTLVVDEADLVFGFGYEGDTKELRQFLPSEFQAVLMSATLTDVKKLRRALLTGAQVRCLVKCRNSVMILKRQKSVYRFNLSEQIFK